MIQTRRSNWYYFLLFCVVCAELMQIRSPDSPNQIQDPHKPRLQTHFKKDNSGFIIKPLRMGWSFAGCHISYVFVTNLFKTIHTASGGCSKLLETFSNSAIVLWTINNYNICQILSQCLYCLWSSSSSMIIVVTVVVIILINSITVVIVVVVINFFMSPLYLVAWSLAVVDNHHHHWQWQHHCHHHHHLLHVPPVLGRLVTGQPVHCFHRTLHLCQLLRKEKNKEELFTKTGLEVVKFS